MAPVKMMMRLSRSTVLMGTMVPDVCLLRPQNVGMGAFGPLDTSSALLGKGQRLLLMAWTSFRVCFVHPGCFRSSSFM
jgi:hypothetical protein